jgi:hypothetical protein
MRFIAAYSITLLLVRPIAIHGEDAPAKFPAVAPQTNSSPTTTAPASSSYSNSYYGGLNEPVSVAAPTPTVDKLDHLLKAAEQLEAADMVEQSNLLRKQYQQMKQFQDEALLQQRLGDLERLQAEVDDLKRTTGRKGQIVIHLQAVEISLDKLSDSDATVKPISEDARTALVKTVLRSSGGEAPMTILDRAVAAESVAALRKDKLLKILAEPSLVTVEGRPVFFNSGGEFPILARQSDGSMGIDFKKYGTQADVAAKLLGGRRIRIEAKLRLSELDSTLNVTAQGVTIPGLYVREIDTGVEMELDKTAVVGGLVSSHVEKVVDPKTHEEAEVVHPTKTVFLITPELVDAAPQPRSVSVYRKLDVEMQQPLNTADAKASNSDYSPAPIEASRQPGR